MKCSGFIKFKFFCSSLLQIRKTKIFCISIQRSGTTSVGQFFKDHGFRTAGYSEQHSKKWSYEWSKGEFDKIFKSVEFKSYQAFEDSPWFYPDFYKVLHSKFPNARFILIQRDSDQWFDSMIKHSKGRTLGNTHRHCKIYRRLTEFYENLDNDPNFIPKEQGADNLMDLSGKRDHYVKVYVEYYREVIEYFKKYAPEKLFFAHLEDDCKWQKLAKYLDIKIDKDYNAHANRSIVERDVS